MTKKKRKKKKLKNPFKKIHRLTIITKKNQQQTAQILKIQKE